eukprot:TRINITY_DN30_c0_g1_i2.p1 TRINITY_DN30_c0_g1~~TRINITY_DN30_c0_g1_i2.p1  ORF type:complete len:684 (-),score=232.54 TRINITY_DN30_c0_g1_i2:31-2082(-)
MAGKKNNKNNNNAADAKDRGMYEKSPVVVASNPSSGITLNVTSTTPVDGKVDVLVTLQTPDVQTRCPQDVVCVVDISGSMGTEATMTSTDGSKESDGLSLLSLVNHAVRTVAASLSSEDRMAVVAFDDVAETTFEFQFMTDDAKGKLVTEVNKLYPRNCTNIWTGLETGLDILKNAKNPNGGRRLSSVILLTDGVPTTSPSGGEAAALERYIDTNKGLPGTVMTFGFGYGINSVLLNGIASVGGGLYCFIPDASIVGTAFVNCISNLQSTVAKNVVLSLEPESGAVLSTEQVGGHPTKVTSWGSQVNLSTLQSGQKKDVVVRLNNVDPTTNFLNVTLDLFNGKETERIEFKQKIEVQNEEEVQINRARLQAVDLILTIAQGEVKKIESFVASIQHLEKDPRIKTLIEDLNGQVKMAVEKNEGYTKWGRHFLPSLARAHQFQQCNNFKDPGVQNYGGKVFGQVRDHLDEVFLKLAPPVPTVGSNAGSTTPVQMGRYYNAYGGCFRGDCRAKMFDGSLRAVQTLRKGDRVAVHGASAEILCVVKTIYASGRAKLVTLPSGLVLTAYHPVRAQDGQWTFPKDIAEEKEEDCDAVYSFLLSEGHVMTIEGTEAVTLAHGIEENSVVKHAYFGTQRVAEDVERMEGFESGLVLITPESFVRDPKTNQVVGLIDQQTLLRTQRPTLVAC